MKTKNWLAVFALTLGLFAAEVPAGPADATQSTTAALTVNFPGLSDAHVYAHETDGTPGAATGRQAASATWKSGNASLTVPRGTYDIRIVHGPVVVVLDAVDCSADCTATVPLATLTVSFPGLRDVHTYAHVSDGAPGTYGAQDSGSTWKAGSSTLVLLRGVYDVRVVHGPVSVVLDAINCGAALCSAEVPLATLTVNFPGLSDAHSYVHVADGAAGTYGAQDSSSTWKANTTSLILLQGVYDVRVVHGPTNAVIDGVDCRAAACVADFPMANLTVNFPGLSDAHSYVHVADGAAGTYGAQDSSSTWKANTTSIVLLQGVYDIRLVHGPTNAVIDGVDCRAAACVADFPMATLTVNFPGLSDAHSYVHVADGAAGTYGAQDSSSTWKTNTTSIVLLRSVYDIRLVHGPTTAVIDGVDCRAASCVADFPMANLTVNFPGLSDAHTYVHATDGAPGTYGAQDSSSTWKSGEATFTLLQSVYDVRVVHGPVLTVLDNIDCRAATCSADVPLTKLRVSFAGHTNVHSYVSLDDAKAAAASGAAVASSTWKSNSTEFVLLRGWYDVLIREGKIDAIVDAVDCRGASCTAALADGVAPGATAIPAKPTVKKSFVSEGDGFVMWRLEPSAPAGLLVWDATIEGCEEFGGASCGKVLDGGPGTFTVGGKQQYLLVTQTFEKVGESCKVANTAEWAENDASTRSSVTATYECSGAPTMGWSLFALFATGAAGLAWVVQRKLAWSP